MQGLQKRLSAQVSDFKSGDLIHVMKSQRKKRGKNHSMAVTQSVIMPQVLNEPSADN